MSFKGEKKFNNCSKQTDLVNSENGNPQKTKNTRVLACSLLIIQTNSSPDVSNEKHLSTRVSLRIPHNTPTSILYPSI